MKAVAEVGLDADEAAAYLESGDGRDDVQHAFLWVHYLWLGFRVNFDRTIRFSSRGQHYDAHGSGALEQSLQLVDKIALRLYISRQSVTACRRSAFDLASELGLLAQVTSEARPARS